MKKNYRIIISVLSFLLVVAAASCSSSGNNSDKSSEAETTTVSVTQATGAITEEVESKQTVKVTDSTESNNIPGQEIDLDSLIYDFSDLKSGEMVQAFTDGKYMISYYIKDFEDTVQTMYFDKDSALVHINSQGVEYDMLYKDNKIYNICQNSRFTQDLTFSAKQLNIFGQFGYIGDGLAEFDGKERRYEEYYDKSGRLKTKLFFDNDGKVFALEEAGTVLYIVDFKADFDSEKIISVPEDTEEVSEEKFTLLMYDLFNNAAASAEDADEADVNNSN